MTASGPPTTVPLKEMHCFSVRAVRKLAVRALLARADEGIEQRFRLLRCTSQELARLFRHRHPPGTEAIGG